MERRGIELLRVSSDRTGKLHQTLNRVHAGMGIKYENTRHPPFCPQPNVTPFL